MASDGYILEQPRVLNEFPLVISSEELKHFLEGFVPLLLMCTESGGWEIAAFETDKEGQFYMLFESHMGEFKAICSQDPEWVQRAKTALDDLSGEKAIAETLPRTDFEDMTPSDSGES